MLATFRFAESPAAIMAWQVHPFARQGRDILVVCAAKPRRTTLFQVTADRTLTDQLSVCRSSTWRDCQTTARLPPARGICQLNLQIFAGFNQNTIDRFENTGFFVVSAVKWFLSGLQWKRWSLVWSPQGFWCWWRCRWCRLWRKVDLSQATNVPVGWRCIWQITCATVRHCWAVSGLAQNQLRFRCCWASRCKVREFRSLVKVYWRANYASPFENQLLLLNGIYFTVVEMFINLWKLVRTTIWLLVSCSEKVKVNTRLICMQNEVYSHCWKIVCWLSEA